MAFLVHVSPTDWWQKHTETHNWRQTNEDDFRVVMMVKKGNRACQSTEGINSFSVNVNRTLALVLGCAELSNLLLYQPLRGVPQTCSHRSAFSGTAPPVDGTHWYTLSALGAAVRPLTKDQSHETAAAAAATEATAATSHVSCVHRTLLLVMSIALLLASPSCECVYSTTTKRRQTDASW